MSTKQLHLSPQLPVSLGSKLSAASLSVVFASDAPGLPITITNDTNYGTPGSNTLRSAAMLGVGSTAVSNANPVPISDAGSSITVDGTVAATQSGVWNITDISGTVSLPTGASTEATLSTLSTTATAISGKLPATLGQAAAAGSLSVILASDQGSLAVAASQSGTWNITNVSGTVSLPTGAATEATLSTASTTLTAISGKLPATLGQKAMTASLAVVLASDQTSIPVTQSGTWNITNVSGTVSLPTGAATETSVATTATNTTTSNIAYQAKGKIAGTSLTGSYATLLDPSSDLRIIYLMNSCDQTILVSLDGGSTDTFELEPAESVSIDLTSSRMKFSNAVNISAKHAGVVPTAGTIRATGIG